MRTTLTSLLRQIGRLALGLGAAAVTLTNPATSHATDAGHVDDVPRDVVAWFATASTVAYDVLVDDAQYLEGQSPKDGTYTVGEPVGLHDWSANFVRGDSDQPVGAAAQWVARLSRDGQVIGTIAAQRAPDGGIEFSYLNDDIPAGTALVEETDAALVDDRRLGGLLAVDADGEARGLSTAAPDELDDVDDVDDLRELVNQAHDLSAQESSLSGDAGSGVLPPGDDSAERTMIVGLTLVGLGTAWDSFGG